MSSPSIYVDSPGKINEVISVCGTVKFVSLLTAIESRNECYRLEMNNFENGSLDSMPYQPILSKKNADCARSAKMVIELICDWFHLDMPELQNDLPFTRNKIHTSSLCFLECKVLYISTQEKRNGDESPVESSSNQYLEYLESVKPISIDRAQELALEKSTDIAKTIDVIFQNLEAMKQNVSDTFSLSLARQHQFENKQVLPPTQESASLRQSESNNLGTSSEKFPHSQNTIRSTSSGTSSNTPSTNPIFMRNRMSSAESQTEQNRFQTPSMSAGSNTDPIFRGDKLSPVESQFDFNSINTQTDQACDPEPEFQRRHYLDATYSSPLPSRKSTPDPDRDDQSPSYKRTKGTRTRVDPIYSDAEDGEILEIRGQFIAVHPLDNLVYFLPEGFERPTHLFPGINCIEIESSAMPLNEHCTIKIERTERDIVRDKFTLAWVLKSPLPPPPVAGFQRPLTWFKDLKVERGIFRHIRMIVLLVSSDFKTRGDFATFNFTDFTSSKISHYKIFDRFLINYDKKLDEEQGIRTLMFPDHYENLDKLFKEAYGKSIAQTYAPASFNHSAHRIVCLLTLRAKLRDNNTLNAIPYRYQIIRPNTMLTLEERRHLFQFCQEAINTKKFYVLGEKLPPYEVPPINADTSDYHLIHCNNAMDLKKATDAFLRRLASSSSSIPSALQSDNECFVINATILCFLTNDNHLDHWTLLVTTDKNNSDNNVIPDDRIVDPTSVLRIEIFGKKNLQYFTAEQAERSASIPNTTITTTHLQNLSKYHGKRCKFRLKRGYITLRSEIALLIWCPIELTFEELGVKLEENPSDMQSQVS